MLSTDENNTQVNGCEGDLKLLTGVKDDVQLGLQFHAFAPGTVVISNIVEESWAKTKGLRIDDEVVCVNGEKTSEMTRDNFIKAMRQRPVKLQCKSKPDAKPSYPTSTTLQESKVTPPQESKDTLEAKQEDTAAPKEDKNEDKVVPKESRKQDKKDDTVGQKESPPEEVTAQPSPESKGTADTAPEEKNEEAVKDTTEEEACDAKQKTADVARVEDTHAKKVADVKETSAKEDAKKKTAGVARVGDTHAKKVADVKETSAKEDAEKKTADVARVEDTHAKKVAEVKETSAKEMPQLAPDLTGASKDNWHVDADMGSNDKGARHLQMTFETPDDIVVQEAAVRDISGCYHDQWGVPIAVTQNGKDLKIKYGARENEGSINESKISVATFRSDGHADDKGGVDFEDGGMWKKLVSQGCHCRDISGNYVDNWNNKVAVRQFDTDIVVDYAGTLKKGTVTENADGTCTVSVQSFICNGCVDSSGNVKFLDGGNWEKAK